MDRRTFVGLTASTLLAGTPDSIKANLFNAKTDERITVRFLGTGAADWDGRDERGELRRLTSILVDGHILIDFTPTDKDMLPADCHPEVIFYTHSHGDHYNPSAALKLGIKQVYLSQTWYDIAKDEFEKAAKELHLDLPVITPIYIGQQITIGDLTFTPLPGNHATDHLFEQALIYLIEKQRTRILYATDTSGLTATATRLIGIDVHQKGTPITALIMEATIGMGHDNDYRLFTHTSVAQIEQIVRVLTATKRYTPSIEQPVYLTHLARTLHGTQAELDAHLPAPLRAAYDGLEVVFQAD
ncbi:MBL fold metallo-hydrolase [Parabacteroides faecis]|uniref:MBL fold metallo-hydrolase n=1 Tax=Parabacteroides faecis TaxID=1217282 RepID=UPI002164A589|nr:MBL fold metallo-hydrolase [Parabacteroides faecis]MCS2892918.1 MBL fold metallo-hydrolase [Parabacteroides faecis]UVQ48474.1 MBL fold metallo-hydrolase [Parabacteroides faecis]